ncbi:MAG: 3-deoxy-D-manno-octulosonic acid transferase [Legionella sp.]|nr:MAG: 3-deoxy-D-manno-octulosonic acid transferase [Legionella sp.]PJD98409.1 MAG: 3-deoxy-D-manno-octulosonic acid transferase [Legionella sp.]
MRWLYSCAFYLITPFLILRLLWKGRAIPAYRTRIAERFCWDKQKLPVIDVWIHAVSLGEVIAATPLIEAMLVDKKWSVVVTTMTPTGAAQVVSCFGDRVIHRYVPYDLPDVVYRFFNQVKPKIGVIIETELWPNLISRAHALDIPLFLINARLSEGSLKGYLRGQFVFKKILNQFTLIGTQSHDDAKRFIRLGADVKKVTHLGNMKFDLSVQNSAQTLFDHLNERMGKERVKIIFASTHEGEESRILTQIKKWQQAIPHVLLLIAPRHPERFQEVYQLCQQQGFNTGLRSQVDRLNWQNEVVVLDSLGELLGFYRISDYAFVGGSLVPIGGHNVLEPIALGLPVFSGNQVDNFKTICHELEQKKAIILVHNEHQLAEELIHLHANPQEKHQMIERATQFLEHNKGSVARYLSVLSMAWDGQPL